MIRIMKVDLLFRRFNKIVPIKSCRLHSNVTIFQRGRDNHKIGAHYRNGCYPAGKTSPSSTKMACFGSYDCMQIVADEHWLCLPVLGLCTMNATDLLKNVRCGLKSLLKSFKLVLHGSSLSVVMKNEKPSL